jgi:hypothetical protein
MKTKLDSILLAMIVGLSGWTLKTTIDHGRTLAVVVTEMTGVKQSLTSTVLRPEYQSKILEIEAKLADINVRLRELEKRP